MTVYIDTSVVLRFLLGQKNAWKDWGRWNDAYSSSLLRQEIRRVIDRLRLESVLDDHGVAHMGSELRRIERTINRIAVSRSILDRASMPMPTVVKTLDAIHLATGLLARERLHPDLIFVTHDLQQANAARALGFECIG